MSVTLDQCATCTFEKRNAMHTPAEECQILMKPEGGCYNPDDHHEYVPVEQCPTCWQEVN